jgi:hypothetical protein
MLRRGPDPLELAGLLQRLERLHVTADASAAGWLPPARAAGELDAPPIADAPFVDPLVAEPVRPAAAKRVRPSRLAGLQARALDPGRRGVAVLAVVALCGAGGGAWYFLRAAPHAVSPATILGVVTAGLAPVSMGAAQLVARVAGIPCAWLVFVARTFARLPGAAIPWPSGTRGSLSLVAILGAGAVVVELWRSRRLRRWLGARSVAHGRRCDRSRLRDRQPALGTRLAAARLGVSGLRCGAGGGCRRPDKCGHRSSRRHRSGTARARPMPDCARRPVAGDDRAHRGFFFGGFWDAGCAARTRSWRH